MDTHRLLPDVILMDVRMPVMDGLEATRQILSGLADPATENTRVIILTTFDLDGYVFAALRAGASGFLLKDTPPELLLAGFRTVAAGNALFAPSVTRRLIRDFLDRPSTTPYPIPPGLETLTDREREVLIQVATGRTPTSPRSCRSASPP